MEQPPQFSPNNIPQSTPGFPAYSGETVAAPIESKKDKKARIALEESQIAPGYAYSWILSLLMLLSPIGVWLVWDYVNSGGYTWFGMIIISVWGFCWALTVVANVGDMIIHKTKRGAGALFLTLATPFIWLLLAAILLATEVASLPSYAPSIAP